MMSIFAPRAASSARFLICSRDSTAGFFSRQDLPDFYETLILGFSESTKILLILSSYCRSIFGGLKTSAFAAGSKSCSPNAGTGNSLGCSGSKCSAFSAPPNF